VPLYEYQCQQCGHRFEKIQSFSAPPEKECPQCQGPVERLISAPAVQFKGSGWYATDYAAKGNSKAAAAGDGDSGKKPDAAPSTSGGETPAPAAAPPASKPTSSDKH
jgi:putative FmdB family regulatory protein